MNVALTAFKYLPVRPLFMAAVPVLAGTFEEKVVEAVEWIDTHIERRRWTNEEIAAKFGQRSAQQILEEGETCYMGPCLDLTLPTLIVLKRNNLDVNFVVDYHHSNMYGYTFHFAIEIQHPETRRMHFLEYARFHTVHFWEGNYHNTKEGSEHLAKDSFHGSQILENARLHDLFGLPDAFSPIQRYPKYSLQSRIQQLQLANTPENYERHQRVCEPRFVIDTMRWSSFVA